ncbi:MAG: mobilization protein [Burkholderiales bacterium]|jgi:hypothetical protein|nr:mobilization protein [Burkholderiales bacterium]
MKPNPLNEKIEVLEERLRKAKMQRAALVSKQKALAKKRNRQDDTRRKILTGAAAQEMINKGLIDGEKFQNFLKTYLVRQKDLSLFFDDENEEKTNE